MLQARKINHERHHHYQASSESEEQEGDEVEARFIKKRKTDTTRQHLTAFTDCRSKRCEGSRGKLCKLQTLDRKCLAYRVDSENFQSKQSPGPASSFRREFKVSSSPIVVGLPLPKLVSFFTANFFLCFASHLFLM